MQKGYCICLHKYSYSKLKSYDKLLLASLRGFSKLQTARVNLNLEVIFNRLQVLKFNHDSPGLQWLMYKLAEL